MSKKLSLREIEEAKELMNLPDHDDAQAVFMMDDIPDSDESPFDVYCFSSGHFFYPKRGSSLEQRAFEHLAEGHDEPLSVSSHECLICMYQASEEAHELPASKLLLREETLLAVANNENVSWR